MRGIVWIGLCVAPLAFPCAAGAEDAIIYRYRVADGCAAKKPPESPTTIFDGQFGPLIKFQAAAVAKLAACGTPLPVSNDGIFGCGLSKAIIKLAQCPQVGPGIGWRSRRWGLFGNVDEAGNTVLQAQEVSAVVQELPRKFDQGFVDPHLKIQVLGV